MPSFSVNCNLFSSIIKLLNANILVITEQLPDPINMKKEWFIQKIGLKVIEETNIVLICDPHSFYFTELLFQIPSFQGVVLCTHPVYRIGRLIIKEIKLLLNNNKEAMKVELSIMPMAFYQPFSYGEICITPYPNGTGIGNSNWLLTIGNDPNLVTFKAFIVSGIWFQPTIFKKPKYPDSLNAICFLPSSVSHKDCNVYLDKLSKKVEDYLSKNKRIVIPSFPDDTFILLVTYLRSKGISNTFYFFSQFFDSLTDVLASMIKNYNNLSIKNLVRGNENTIDNNSVSFPPYPTMGFGEITKIADQNWFPNAQIIKVFKPFTPSKFRSSWNKTASLAEKINRNDVPLTVFGGNPPLHKNRDDFLNYHFADELPISDDILRWMDLNKLNISLENINHEVLVKGEIEGERAIPHEMQYQNITGVYNLKDIGFKLREQGATCLQLHDQTIDFKFEFLDGDNEASIEINGEDITITTGSTLIENIIYIILGLKNEI